MGKKIQPRATVEFIKEKRKQEKRMKEIEKNLKKYKEVTNEKS